MKNSDGTFITRSKTEVDIISENFEKEVRKYSKNFKTGTFVDVGAGGDGKYSIIISKQIKNADKVISIEPNEGNFNLLKRNIEINNCRNVIPLKIACWNKRSKLKLYDHVKSGKFSIIQKSSKFSYVDALPLDQLIKNMKIPRIGLVKIDVEGAEPNVLEGMKNILRYHKPKVIFETWDNKHFNKCKNILETYGYKLNQIEKFYWIAQSTTDSQ